MGDLDAYQPDDDTQEIRIECCPVCKGIMEHTLGCPEQDKPR
jgi:hypothetical protein